MRLFKKVMAAGLLMGASIQAADIYVAPGGSDSNPGTLQKPLKTLAAARDRARAEKSTVWLRGGLYRMPQTLVLTPKDSGTSYRAFKGETPVLSGARKITGWHKAEDNLSGVNPKAKGKVWSADIPKGWLFHFMYIDGRMVQRSRWINNSVWRKWPKDHIQGKPEERGQLITLKQNKEILKHIPNNGDAEMVCIMFQYGVMGNGVVRDINPAAGTFRWNSRQTNVRRSRNPHERGYNFENALWLIDEPGEWAVDSVTGKAYYWPKDGENLASATVEAPHLYEIIQIKGDSEKGPVVKNITLSGLTLKYTDRLPEDQWPYTWLMRQWENVDAALYISGAEDCTITGNRILYSGSYGITLNHYAQRIRIEHNEIGWTGSGGLFLEGYGPGTLDVNHNNLIAYNYIHDHGLANYWHSPSIQIYQSGHNHIHHNLMQRSAYSGLSMVGMNPKYMNELKHMKPGVKEGQRHPWNYFCPRWEDFPQEARTAVENRKKYFNRTNMKPYMHSRENLIERNVVVDPHSLLNEGGAFYAWCPGKDNIWRENIVFVSHAMPGSSIYALDDMAEYFVVKDNVFWVNGSILNGVGARSTERGNKISGNHRVMFKPQYASRKKRGLGSWWTNEPGRESLDKLFAQIESDVSKSQWKGWPGNPPIGIPGIDKTAALHTGAGPVLPKGSHVTIEE